MQEHDRQQKKKAGVPPSQDTCQVWLDLKKVNHLLIGDIEEERDKNWVYLIGLTELAREEELYHRDQWLKAQEEFTNLSDGSEGEGWISQRWRGERGNRKKRNG